MRARRKRACASLLLLLAAAPLSIGPTSTEAGTRKKAGIQSNIRKKSPHKPLEVYISPQKGRGHDDSFLGKAPRVPYVAFRRDGSVLDWRGSLPTVGLPEPRIATFGAASFSGKVTAILGDSATGERTITGDSSIAADFTSGGGSFSGTINNITTGAASKPSTVTGGNHPPINGGFFALKPSGGATASGGSSSGEYQGAFYGPNASEIAGTFSFGSGEGRPGSGAMNIEAIGAFGGNK